ncbi:helix-turn-helix domain-containing protein, partial [Escherichia sp. TWPC-MK]
ENEEQCKTPSWRSHAFLQSEITQQELARRIGKPKQEITRLFNLHHATKIDAVQLAAKALGKELSPGCRYPTQSARVIV